MDFRVIIVLIIIQYQEMKYNTCAITLQLTPYACYCADAKSYIFMGLCMENFKYGESNSTPLAHKHG